MSVSIHQSDNTLSVTAPYHPDFPEAEQDLVTLRVTLMEDSRLSTLRGPIYLAGREIATAWGRDSGAKLGAGIVLLKGSVGSGGSMKNWRTNTSHGAIFEIRDLPREMTERVVMSSEVRSIEIIEPVSTPEITRKTLEEERSRLLARLAEIDQLLGSA